MYKNLEVGDYVLIRDNSKWSGKVCLIESVDEKVAYAVCVNFPFEKYWINEDTYKYIQKVNCNKVG
jgi:hypothetical protein